MKNIKFDNNIKIGIVLEGSKFIAHTYPMKYAGVTGLPCRVVAEI